jgi:hypothetical protein
VGIGYSSPSGSNFQGNASRTLSSWGNDFWGHAFGGTGGINRLTGFTPFVAELGADVGMLGGVDPNIPDANSNEGPTSETLRVVQGGDWTILRGGISGGFDESIFGFPTEELTLGENIIQLQLPKSAIGQDHLIMYDGIIYDYVRLELGTDTVVHDPNTLMPNQSATYNNGTGPVNGGQVPAPNPPPRAPVNPPRH